VLSQENALLLFMHSFIYARGIYYANEQVYKGKYYDKYTKASNMTPVLKKVYSN
jgi:hypothetical protein